MKKTKPNKAPKLSKAEFEVNGESHTIKFTQDEFRFFSCECHGEGIFVKKFAGESELCVSFWKEGFDPTKLTWSARFRLIWAVITKGTPFCDMVILSQKTTKELSSYINKIS